MPRLLLLTLAALSLLPDSVSMLQPSRCQTLHTRELSILNCTGRSLERIPKNLAAADRVLLDNNRLHRLPNGAFDSYFSLRSPSLLSLAHNNLSLISAGAFDSLTRLRSLRLNHNGLRLPEAWVPAALPDTLEDLDLSDNPLDTLPSHHFAHLERLKSLRAANARLRQLGGDALAGLTNLRELDLLNNQLTSLPQQNTDFHLKAMPDLSRLRLGGSNPWTCDCRLVWLKRWLNSRPFVSTESTVLRGRDEVVELAPVCAQPRDLRGQELFSHRLAESALDCDVGPFLVQLDPDLVLYACIAGAWLLGLLSACGALTYCLLPKAKYPLRPEAPPPPRTTVILKVPAEQQHNHLVSTLQRQHGSGSLPRVRRIPSKAGDSERPPAPPKKAEEPPPAPADTEEVAYQLHHLPRMAPHSPPARHEPHYQLLSASLKKPGPPSAAHRHRPEPPRREEPHQPLHDPQQRQLMRQMQEQLTERTQRREEPHDPQQRQLMRQMQEQLAERSQRRGEPALHSILKKGRPRTLSQTTVTSTEPPRSEHEETAT